MANPYYPENDDKDEQPFDGVAAPEASSALSGLPDWARIHADVPDEDEAPVAPVVRQPVAPAPVQTPLARPARPVQRPTPAVPVPAPQVPVSVPIPVAAPTPTPAPVAPQTQPKRPGRIIEPEVTPEPVDDVPFYELEKKEAEVVVVEPVVAPAAIPEMLPQPVQEPRRRLLQFPSSEGRSKGTPEEWEPAETKAVTNKAVRKTSAAAGGRWKLTLAKIAFWGVVGLVLLLGVIRIVNPNPISIDSVAQQVEASLGQNGFPITAGTALGSKFTTAYLDYDPNDGSARATALSNMLSSSADTTFTFTSSSNSSYTQSVTEGPYLVSSPELVDSQHATYIFAAAVSNSQTGTTSTTGAVVQAKWVYLQVAIVADKNGHVSVDGAPAFVPAPPGAGSVPSIANSPDKDASASATATVQGYMAAWAAASRSDPVSSVYLRNSTSAAADGLGGSVKLVGSPTVTIDALPPAAAAGTTVDTTNRTGEVTVQWQTTTGLSFTQTYRLSLAFVAQHWYITDIKGATFN